MKCTDIREALSAQLDGERANVPLADVETHLISCAGCRDWQRSAAALHRRVRLSAAPAVEDRSERILARVAVAEITTSAATERSPGRLPRLCLAALAVTQLALSGPVLLLGHDHMAPIHIAHEVGSFDAALAIGLLLAAMRPRLAVGMLPLVAAITGLLVLTAGSDLAVGRTVLSEEAPHLLDVIGLLLIIRLASQSGSGRSRMRMPVPGRPRVGPTAPGVG